MIALRILCAATSIALLGQVAGIAFRPCPVEDASGPCHWDAASRGNGAGRDFLVLWPNIVLRP